MKRRSGAGSQPAKARWRKAASLKRRNAPKAARNRGASIAGQETEVARFHRERDEALERETATSEVLRLISKSPGDLELVFRSILENATRLCEAQFGLLFRYDGRLFNKLAVRNVPAVLLEFMEQRGAFLPPAGTALHDHLVTRDVVHRADASAAQTQSAPVRLAGAKSFLAVPMFKDEALVGAISIYRQEVRPFTDKQIELLQNFAAQAVIAIENTRLLNELRQSLEQQTATADVLRVISSSPGELELVFEAMLTNATRLCEAKFGVLYLYDEGRLCFGASHDVPTAFAEARGKEPFTPAPDTGTGRVVATKQAVQIADLAATQSYSDRDPVVVAAVEVGGVRTLLSVPMLKENALVGVISIYRNEVRPFTDKQTALLQNFAAQAVIAIENARLLNELRQRTTDLSEALEQQTATSEVLRVISSSPGDLQPVFQTMLQNAVRVCDAKFGTLFRFDGKAFHFAEEVGTPPELAEWHKQRGPFLPLPGSNLERAVQTQKVCHSADVVTEAIPSMAGRLGGARSVVCVPMLKDRGLVGAMTIYRQEVRPFTDKQIELVKNFAAQAVIAIENTRLLKELRERTDEVVKLNQQLEHRVADQVSEIERMGRLRRFLPPQVADLIVASGTEKQLESHRREITALFCDLRGFTGFSESSDPEDVMALLRDYHGAIGQIVIKYGGTLERFAGDGVMVIFNDPVPVENPALQAVLMALEMRDAIGALTETWHRWGHDIGFGIGIAHGFATLGTIGFEGRFDYAAIGTVSNVASRLCDEAKPGQILIAPRVLTKVENAVTVEPVGEFNLKGIRRPMAAYNVLDAIPKDPN